MTETDLKEWAGDGGKLKRPKLDIPRGQLEIFCELIAATVVICITVYLIAVWPSLPSRIPVHYNFSGQVDRWGNRSSLLSLFGVMLAMYVGFSILHRFPRIYNYPFALTPQNVFRQYQIARQLITLEKTGIVCSFAFMTWQTVQVANGKFASLGIWFLPVMMLFIFGTLAHYFQQAYKAR